MVVAVLGTTISPYLFFWQASQEVEEMQRRASATQPLRDARRAGGPRAARIKVDTIVGMMLSNRIAFFIILTTAADAARARHHQTSRSAAQAAEALRPLAGDFAFALFALGIIGTGLLAVPVLARLGRLCRGARRSAGTPRWSQGEGARVLRDHRGRDASSASALGFTPWIR